MTLAVLTMLFVPSKSSLLSWGFNNILSNVKELNEYDWPTYIYAKLMHSLETEEPKKVNGCVMLIPYWVMEHFPITVARSSNAKLWCEKWDLKKLMDLRKTGPITQVIETQASQHLTGKTMEICEVGSGSENNDDSRKEKDENNSIEFAKMHLGDNSDTWNDCFTSTVVAVGEGKASPDVVVQLTTENAHLKSIIEMKDVEINELIRCIENFKSKEACHEDLVLELEEVRTTLLIKEKENKALLKRLSNRGSSIEVLSKKNGALVEENIELAVSKYTQVAYAKRDTAAALALLLDHNMNNEDQQRPSEFPYNLVSQAVPQDGKVINSAIQTDTVENEDFDAFMGPLKIDTPDCEHHQNKKNEKQTGQNTIHMNSLVERIKTRERKEKLKRKSFVYGAEAEGKQARKRLSQKSVIVAPPEHESSVQPFSIMIRKMPNSTFISKELIRKMSDIENAGGTKCKVVSFTHRKDAVVSLDDIYGILNGSYMSSLVVNAHAEMLMSEHNTENHNKIAIFDNTIWSLVKGMELKDASDCDKTKKIIDEALLKYKRTGLFMFPITTNSVVKSVEEPYHLTLLVFNTEDPYWLFFNSKKTRGGRDRCKKDAEKLKNYIEGQFMREWRDSELNDESIDTTQYHTHKLSSPPSPQQTIGSLDCGVFVCYAMEQLVVRGKVPTKLSSEELLKYKAYLVQRLLDQFDETSLVEKV